MSQAVDTINRSMQSKKHLIEKELLYADFNTIVTNTAIKVSHIIKMRESVCIGLNKQDEDFLIRCTK